MRRPSWQFYPGDWQSNPKLRRCSHAEKGIWLDVLCILHDQDEYGIVRWPLKDLAIAVHAKSAALQSLVDKEVLKGADIGGECAPFIYTPRHSGRDGEPATLIQAQPGPIWYSSRMVRDEHIRLARAANEPKPKVGSKAAPKAGIGPTLVPDLSRAGASSSSSSAFSSSTSLNSTHTHEPPRASVCVKSRFSLEQNLQYAKASCQTDNGIKQPDAWAAANYASGMYDEMVERFLENPENHFQKAVVW